MKSLYSQQKMVLVHHYQKQHHAPKTSPHTAHSTSSEPDLLLQSLTPLQLTASHYDHLSSTPAEDRPSYDGATERKRERHITYLYTCTTTNQRWAICSAALNQMGRWQTELSFSYRSLPFSLSSSQLFLFLSLPMASHTILWLTPLLSCLFLGYQPRIYYFWTSLRFLHPFIRPVLTFCQLFFLMPIFLYPCSHQYMLLMTVLLLAKGIVLPILAIQFLTIQVDTNIHNFCLWKTIE